MILEEMEMTSLFKTRDVIKSLLFVPAHFRAGLKWKYFNFDVNSIGDQRNISIVIFLSVTALLLCSVYQLTVGISLVLRLLNLSISSWKVQSGQENRVILVNNLKVSYL